MNLSIKGWIAIAFCISAVGSTNLSNRGELCQSMTFNFNDLLPHNSIAGLSYSFLVANWNGNNFYLIARGYKYNATQNKEMIPADMYFKKDTRFGPVCDTGLGMFEDNQLVNEIDDQHFVQFDLTQIKNLTYQLQKLGYHYSLETMQVNLSSIDNLEGYLITSANTTGGIQDEPYQLRLHGVANATSCVKSASVLDPLQYDYINVAYNSSSFGSILIKSIQFSCSVSAQLPTMRPSRKPSLKPIVQSVLYAPSKIPSGLDPAIPLSTIPSSKPSVIPVAQSILYVPSMVPSVKPTVVPSRKPSLKPIAQSILYIPSMVPSVKPTVVPSPKPSLVPIVQSILYIPSMVPSVKPTVVPSPKPSLVPIVQSILYIPSVKPSLKPIAGLDPVFSPSSGPSYSPSLTPSYSPSYTPSVFPSKKSRSYAPVTVRPTTTTPSIIPTRIPTYSPTIKPTVSPTRSPSKKPSIRPTKQPTFTPSVSLTYEPSVIPTSEPTSLPSTPPTFNPSVEPSSLPSITPTKRPTVKPSVRPSISPSRKPSFKPSFIPSQLPTSIPSVTPTYEPSISPTVEPTIEPSSNPTFDPTTIPTVSPTQSPSMRPTVKPSVVPSRKPSFKPSFTPSQMPSVSPSYTPTLRPTLLAFDCYGNFSTLKYATAVGFVGPELSLTVKEGNPFTSNPHKLTITARGYNLDPSSSPTSSDMIVKVTDGDSCETGLGMIEDIGGLNEIDNYHFIQLDFTNIFKTYGSLVAFINIGSIHNETEGFELYGSNEVGELGELYYTSDIGPSCDEVAFAPLSCNCPRSSNDGYKYISVKAAEFNSLANVLINSIQLYCGLGCYPLSYNFAFLPDFTPNTDIGFAQPIVYVTPNAFEFPLTARGFRGSDVNGNLFNPGIPEHMFYKKEETPTEQCEAGLGMVNDIALVNEIDNQHFIQLDLRQIKKRSKLLSDFNYRQQSGLLHITLSSITIIPDQGTEGFIINGSQSIGRQGELIIKGQADRNSNCSQTITISDPFKYDFINIYGESHPSKGHEFYPGFSILLHSAVFECGNITGRPSMAPTEIPSYEPTSFPSIEPSYLPTGSPSLKPTIHPSNLPSRSPTSRPSLIPTNRPNVVPDPLASCQAASVHTGSTTYLAEFTVNQIFYNVITTDTAFQSALENTVRCILSNATNPSPVAPVNVTYISNGRRRLSSNRFLSSGIVVVYYKVVFKINRQSDRQLAFQAYVRQLQSSIQPSYTYLPARTQFYATLKAYCKLLNCNGGAGNISTINTIVSISTPQAVNQTLVGSVLADLPGVNSASQTNTIIISATLVGALLMCCCIAGLLCCLRYHNNNKYKTLNLDLSQDYVQQTQQPSVVIISRESLHNIRTSESCRNNFNDDFSNFSGENSDETYSRRKSFVTKSVTSLTMSKHDTTYEENEMVSGITNPISVPRSLPLTANNSQTYSHRMSSDSLSCASDITNEFTLSTGKHIPIGHKMITLSSLTFPEETINKVTNL